MVKRFLSVLGVAVLLVSCSEDSPTTPTASDKFLASKAGSFFINNNTIVTGTAEAPVDSITTTDSVVVGAETTIDGKKATPFVTYNAAGTATDTTYMYQDGDKIYVQFDLSYDVGSGLNPINLGKRWVLVADAKATTSWVALQDTVSNLSITYSGIPLTGNVGINFSGAKTSTETLTINGTSVETVKYTLTSNTTVYIATPVGPVVVPIATSISYWFAKNVGLVKTSQPPFNVAFSALGTPVDVDVPGSRSTTIRFKVD